MVGRLVKGVGLALGLVAGGYGLATAAEILQAKREEGRFEEVQALAAAAAALKQKQVAREEGAVALLLQEVQLQHHSLEEIEGEVATVRQRLGELEALRAAKLNTLSTAAAAAEEAGRRLALLRAEASHHRAAASSASQALLEAHRVAAQKRELVNPLNHPLVRSALGRA